MGKILALNFPRMRKPKRRDTTLVVIPDLGESAFLADNSSAIWMASQLMRFNSVLRVPRQIRTKILQAEVGQAQTIELILGRENENLYQRNNRLIFWFLSYACIASDFFILSPKVGRELVNQCSRNAPLNVDYFFKPTEIEIRKLEALLPVFLHNEGARPLSEFNRQYLGFSRSGKKYIYGNFYFHEVNSANQNAVPVLGCDGGDNFWGIVFSLSTSEFSDFERNGALNQL